MKKVKKIKILNIILITIIICILYYNFKVEEVIINYITDEKQELTRLNDMKFEILFGAPHYYGFESYRYLDEKFFKSGEYTSSPRGEESMEYINKIINLDEDIDNYEDIRDKYGQIALIKELDEFVFIIFDGYFNSEDGYKKI